MPRYVSIVPLLAAAAILIAACGSTSSASGDPSSGAGNQADTIAFAQCMRSHGVPNFPDPGSNGRGGLLIQASQRAGSGSSLTVNGVPVNAPAFKSAMQSCRKDLPNGGTPSAAQTAKVKAAALAMSRCMRAHGVPNFPDPVFHTAPGGGGFGIQLNGAGTDRNSPAFQAAQKICQPLFGGVGSVEKAAP